MSQRRIGNARFQSPQTYALECVHDDPIRYMKQRAGDKKEGVKNYVAASRDMLVNNIGIMNR